MKLAQATGLSGGMDEVSGWNWPALITLEKLGMTPFCMKSLSSRGSMPSRPRIRTFLPVVFSFSPQESERPTISVSPMRIRPKACALRNIFLNVMFLLSIILQSPPPAPSGDTKHQVKNSFNTKAQRHKELKD